MKEKSKAPTVGGALEELLRAFFLRAGFFVMRGVPFRFAEEDLTDVDLWLYERPTGTARRVQICDIKYKQRPKAVERIFWTSGLAKALKVDGAYVATTDKRNSLRAVANGLGIQLIDGGDIQRIQQSSNVLYAERIGDEELIAELYTVDSEFRNKTLQEARIEILSSLSEGFGAPSAVRALEAFSRLATAVIGYHPDSAAARAAGRLSYLSAAIICQSLDYVSVEAAFRSAEERRELILDAVRFGALGNELGRRSLQLALGLVEKYAPGGKAAARAIDSSLRRDLGKIPAEVVADQAVRLLRGDQLFLTGRDLESAAYHRSVIAFDSLNTYAKSMFGAFLDYSGVDRERFANAWKPRAVDLPTIAPPLQESEGQQS